MAKTIEQLQALAQQIKQETIAKKNDATRVGGMLEDVVDKMEANEVDVTEKLATIGAKVDDLQRTSATKTELNNIKPIVVEGDVTNAQDEEDLTSENGLLKLKNRTATSSEMGYVILRKNKSFASQVTQANTIYEIRYAFDLGGATITMPSACTLMFNGGKLDNGTVIFSDTRIVGVSACFGVNTTFGGRILGDRFKFDWLDCDRSITLDQYTDFTKKTSDFDTPIEISSVNSNLLSRVVDKFHIEFGRGIYAFDQQITTAVINAIGQGSSTLLWFPKSRAFTFANGRFHKLQNLRVEAYGEIIYVAGKTTENIVGPQISDCTLISYKNHCVFEDFSGTGTASGVFYEARFSNIKMCCGPDKGFFTNIKSNSNYYSGIVDWPFGYNGGAIMSGRGIAKAILYNSSCRLFEKSTFLMTGAKYFAYTDKTDTDCHGIIQLQIRVRDCWFEDAKTTNADYGFKNIVYINSTTHSILEFDNVGVDQKTAFSRYDNNVYILAKCPRIHLYGDAIWYDNGVDCPRINNFTNRDIHHIDTSESKYYYITARKTYHDNKRIGRSVSVDDTTLSSLGFGALHVSNPVMKKYVTFIDTTIPDAVVLPDHASAKGIWASATSHGIFRMDGTDGAHLITYNALGETNISALYQYTATLTKNMLYKIYSAIDLDGKTITCSDGNTLEFIGRGALNNGTILVKNDTLIKNFKGTATVIPVSGQTGCQCFGTTDNRSNVANKVVGLTYFDTTINAPVWWNGTSWIDLATTVTPTLTTGTKIAEVNGMAIYAPKNGYGTTRPQSPQNGEMYFDTTLAKPIFYTEDKWVDASGTEV